MKKTYFPFLIVLAIFMFSSCATTKSPLERLTQLPWKATNIEERTGTGPWSNSSWVSMPACEKDDVYVFRSNLSFEINEGSTKCSPSDPQIIESGSWFFVDNETKVNVGGSVLLIEALTDNQLVLSMTETFGGITYSERISFGH